jgi:PhzF family phenazine biosynthesis protein
MMEMPEAEFIKGNFDSAETDELYQALGIEWKPVNAVINGENTVELLPQLISAGFPDIFVPVESRRALAAIAPDFKALSELSEKHGTGGVHAFTLDTPGDEIMACTRNFAPLFGIDEEAATGTASGGLAYYLYRHGMRFDESHCCFLQGEAMGKPSKIFVSINAYPDFIEIKAGGKGAVLAEGEIYL